MSRFWLLGMVALLTVAGISGCYMPPYGYNGQGQVSQGNYYAQPAYQAQGQPYYVPQSGTQVSPSPVSGTTYVPAPTTSIVPSNGGAVLGPPTTVGSGSRY